MVPAELEDLIATSDKAPNRHQSAAAAIDPSEVVESFNAPTEPLDRLIRTVEPARQIPVRTASCPVCGCRSARPRYAVEGGEFSLVTCVECGLGHLHPRPTSARLQTFYPPEYYGDSGEKFVPLIEFGVRKAAAAQARRLTRGLPTGSRVLDVGCGRGTMLSAMSQLGFEAHGFEISDTARNGSDAKARVHVGESLSAAALPANHFDLVIVWHVLEHLPNPKQILTEIRRILKPGGRIAVAVPNFSSWQAKWTGPGWFHLDLPRHLFHFSTECLRRIIVESGFDIDAERHFSLRQNPFGWVQSILNRCVPNNRNALYSLLKRRPKRSGNRPTRGGLWWQRLAYWVGMPIGLMVSCIAAACRQGATLCVTGTARAADPDSSSTCSRVHHANLDQMLNEHPEYFPPNDACGEVDSLETHHT